MFYNFFCMTTPSRCSLTNWSWGRSGASWWHLEVQYGFKNFFTYIKSYMSYNLCFMNFFVWPTLIGAAILKKPKNRISGSGWTGTGLKKNTYIKSYMSYNSYFINFFVWPTLIGAGILEKPDFRISGSGWTGTGLKKKLLTLNHI